MAVLLTLYCTFYIMRPCTSIKMPTTYHKDIAAHINMFTIYNNKNNPCIILLSYKAALAFHSRGCRSKV